MMPVSLASPTQSRSLDPVIAAKSQEIPSRLQTAKKVFEYIPDVWSVLDSGLVLAGHAAYHIPVPIRMMVAAFGVLNLGLIPSVFVSIFNLVRDLTRFSNRGLTGWGEGLVRLAYLSSLISALGAITVSGILEYCKRLLLPIRHLQLIVDAVFPWGGCCDAPVYDSSDHGFA